jgi:PAS domain S-box-containing protein
MEAGHFSHSFSLFDADGRLVDWDENFPREWAYAVPVLKTGVRYAELLRAALSDPRAARFVQDNFESSNIEEHIRNRLAGFGTDRTLEYRANSGRIIRVDERRTASGGVHRLARDITDEKNVEGVLAEVQQHLGAVHSDSYGVLTQSRRRPDGSYIFEPVTEALCRLLDLPAELVGQDPALIYSRMEASPEEDARRVALLENSARTLESFSTEYRVRDGKDRMRWLRQSFMPRREADGAVVYASVLRDVTREKEAEDQFEMLRSVVVRSSDSIVIFESDPLFEGGSDIVYVNARFTELFGWSADELIGRQDSLLHNRRVIGRPALRAALLRNDGQPVEFETSSRSGRVFWVEAQVAVIQKFQNGRVRWAVISRDISERRHVQEELLRAKEEAEAGNRAKSYFLANMSHELRTPLNAIIGFAELIEQGVERNGWNESYREYLGDVTESGRHLLDLINTILDLSKIEAGSFTLELEPVDLGALINASLALLSGMAAKGGLTFLYNSPAESTLITGDAVKLKQVLLNVLSNAVKFTPPGGLVTVTLAESRGEAKIVIEDTGCGIPEADLERVLLPFAQAESTLARNFPGSGLGLSIALQLCKLHGGRLGIESVQGQGTRVSIFLPGASAPAEQARAG